MNVPLADLPAFAADVLARLPRKSSGASLVALSGDLGAGKTTLVQALSRALGVEEPVVSPTYVLMKSYPLKHQRWERLIHVDFYRLEKPEELEPLKLGEVLADPKNFVCLEWPERAEGKLPNPDLALRLSSEGMGAGERNVEIVQ